LGGVRKLNLAHCRISDVEGLAAVEVLDIWGTQISDVSRLKNLKRLYAYEMPNIDVSMLAARVYRNTIWAHLTIGDTVY